MLGVVGGLAPESTRGYYRALVAASRQRRPHGSYPPRVLNSIDLTRPLGFIEPARLRE